MRDLPNIDFLYEGSLGWIVTSFLFLVLLVTVPTLTIILRHNATLDDQVISAEQSGSHALHAHTTGSTLFEQKTRFATLMTICAIAVVIALTAVSGAVMAVFEHQRLQAVSEALEMNMMLNYDIRDAEVTLPLFDGNPAEQDTLRTFDVNIILNDGSTVLPTTAYYDTEHAVAVILHDDDTDTMVEPRDDADVTKFLE